MKKSLIVLPGLLLAAASSMAMSLGRHSGATLIGRPLDITVQATLDAQEDVSSQCPEADVFYGENKLAGSRVNVTIEKSAATASKALIRIRSPQLIDEPVVTFYLRVGCRQKTERRYVALAELVSEAAADRNTPATMPLVSPAAPVAAQSPSPAPQIAPVPTPATTSRSKASRSRGSASETKAATSNASTVESAPAAKVQRSSKSAQSRRAARSEKAAQARLKLEPLDLSIERDPQLKASTEMLSSPAADPRERAAASALWRALSAQPEDILRDADKLKSLESSVTGLQAQNKKGLMSIDDLNVKLKQAEAERYANMLVYGLVVLLLAALAGLAFLLSRRGTISKSGSADKPWWRKNEVYENQQVAWRDSLLPSQQDQLGDTGLAAAPMSRPANAEVDFEIDPATSRPVNLGPAPSTNYFEPVSRPPKSNSGFGPSAYPSRSVKAEELFDVQQQADFFVSIGQHEQAIELLQSHIAENPETSALVHLDLFNLYHQLNRPADYDQLRGTFNLRYNAQVPTFDLYTDKTVGLESYQLALSRIEALWPSAKVLEVIEESLFRRPDTQAEAFNLEAYRELLLLYSIAKDINNAESTGAAAARAFDVPARYAESVTSRAATFMPTAIQPLSASMDANRKAVKSAPADAVPPPSLNLGLDIDLGELSASDKQSSFDLESDAQFFAQLDAEDTRPVSHLNSASMSLVDKAEANQSGLIDFDDFDLPEGVLGKPKTPRN